MKDLSKIKRFPMSGQLLLSLFADGREIHMQIRKGFPFDAVIVRQYYDRSVGMYFLVVHSETFESLADGKEIPVGEILVDAVPEKEKTNDDQGANAAQTTEGQTDVGTGSQPGAGGS